MSFRLRRVAARVRYRAKHFVGRHPRLYPLVFRHRDGYEDRLVTDDTDLCIEGFPRSANSFAVGAFEYAQDEELNIAHHNHVPAPILNAARRGFPTVVLIRDPVEAVISNRGLQLQIGAVEGKEMPQRVSYETQLQTWMSFYKTVEAVLDRVIVAPFEIVIDDFGVVVESLNNKFRTDFGCFEHTDGNVEAIRGSRGYHALPSDERDAMKAQARERFDREVDTEHGVVQRARSLHRRFVEQASVC